MLYRDLVFFSYTHSDGRWLKSLRGVLEPYVLDEKLKVWSDREIEVGNRWHGDIQDALARARVAVLLISQSFFASKYIRENELPRLVEDARKGLLTLICVPVGDVDPELLGSWQLSTYQFASSPNEPLSARKGRRRERAVVEIAICVKEAYRRLEGVPVRTDALVEARYRDAAAISPVVVDVSNIMARQMPGALFGVPALDEQHYVERTHALVGLKQLLLEGTNLAAGVTSVNRAERVGLHGMGGMGKTVLAQAFCHDLEVRRAFADGIYWVTLGQEPSILAEQTRLLKMLDEHIAAVGSSAQARDLLRTCLANKRVLLVIDDVWRAEHFQAFDVVSGQSRVLLTTRDGGVLRLIGAREEVLDRLDESLAKQLIAEWAGVELVELPEDAERVARLCGHHPLALALAGAQIADGVLWSTLVVQLERGKIDFLDHDYGSVFDSLGRSVDALSEGERARFLELAVFPEDARIPSETIARLWKYSGDLDEAETEKLLSRFHRKSLLKRALAGDIAYINFHDLQRDFVRIRAKSQQSLSILLLDAYRSSLLHRNGATAWSTLPANEPYLWTGLASHLVDAGRQQELRALLLDIDWIRSKLNASTATFNNRRSTDVNALLSDYDCMPEDAEVALTQHALRMSSHVLSANPDQVGFQLYGRLGASNAPIVQRLCREAIDQFRGRGLIPARPALNTPGALVRTLAGHDRGVRGATLLADGRRALSWSDDGTLKLWDLERGELLHTLASCEGGVRGVTPLADGRRALLWSKEGALKLWDLERGELLYALAGHEGGVRGTTVLGGGRRSLSWRAFEVQGVTLLADGRRALSWSDDGTLKLWDLERDELLHTLAGHEGGVLGATLLADGCRALSWSDDQTLKLWDLERGELLHTLAGHDRGVRGATLLADGRRALSWSNERTLKLWDLERGELLHTLAGHEGGVRGAKLLADGQRVLSLSEDGTLKLWDLERGELLHTLAGHERAVLGATLLPDGRRVLSWSNDRTLKLWDLERGELLHTLAGHERAVLGATLLADGRRGLSWSDDGTLKLWDLERGELLQALAGHEDSVRGATLLADGRRALSWSDDRTLKLWDLERGEPLHTLAGHERGVRGATLLADGRRALSWAKDPTLKLWDLERGDLLNTLVGHEDSVRGATLLADGRRTLSWSDDRTLKLWDLECGELLRTLVGHEDWVRGATLLAGGLRALSWSDDRTLKLWDLERGELLQTLAGHEGWVLGARLLADGRRALSWSNEQTLKLWDLERGELLHTLAGHEGGVRGAKLLADDRRALSWSDDRTWTLKLWDLERGELLYTFAGHESWVRGATLLADGRRALSWADDRTLRLWDLDRGELLQTLAGHEGEVLGAMLLADGRHALSWSDDRTLQLVDLERQRVTSTYFADAALCTPAIDEFRGRIFAGDGLGRIHIIRLDVQAN